MKVYVREATAEAADVHVVIVGLFEPASLPDSLKKADELTEGSISDALDNGFKGEAKQVFAVSTRRKLPSRRILLVGLGKKEDFTLELLRKASGMSLKAARDLLQLPSVATLLHEVDIPNTTREQRVQAVTEGLVLGNYQFVKYKTVDTDRLKFAESATILADDSLKDVVEAAVITAEAQNWARDLVNEPGSSLTPEGLAKEAKKLSKLNNVKVTVHDKASIEKLGLHALLAVNRGSVNEPRFIVIEYDGGGKTIALCGKGITFDSGGLDLKTAQGMDTMKEDMAGAATVIGTISAAARLKLKAKVVGVISSTENMPGQNAYKPGDIIQTYHGKTIEVGNTDAEGRVALADALTYADRDLKADTIIDVATLTGAVVFALGSIAAGVVGKDAELVSTIKEAGEKTGERVWELPLWPEYQELVKAELGDVYNIGNKAREAGTIVGAAFLAEFVEKAKWAHLDIAGVAFAKDENDYWKKGGTGFGVRLLVEVIRKWA